MAGKPPPGDPRQCTADSKRRPGERCEAWAMKGRSTCYHHGGMSPIGAGSPHFKDGRRSRFSSILTGTNLRRYEDAIEDPAYVELREEMAVVQTLLFDALERAQVGRTGDLWDDLETWWTRFQMAHPAKDATAASRCLMQIGKIISEGTAAHRANEEAKDLIERKRKLAESERKRLVDESQMITAQKALTFAAALGAVIRRHVRDRETLAAIHADIALLIHQDVSSSGGVLSGP